ncbi:MAG TPA: hypothetical protein VEA99_14450 [Gemmatimonadaceae bacterium]|nr:hypothetical protein [Gemmatimonadaceae bacterium]
MTTKLEKALKREVDVNGVAYTVTLSPDGLKLVEKGKRTGQELSWEQLVRGDVALTQDLADSIDMTME